jgi:hypothetical protein
MEREQGNMEGERGNIVDVEKSLVTRCAVYRLICPLAVRTSGGVVAGLTTRVAMALLTNVGCFARPCDDFRRRGRCGIISGSSYVRPRVQVQTGALE